MEQIFVVFVFFTIERFGIQHQFMGSSYKVQRMGVSINRGFPKWLVYNGKSYSNGWFGGTPHFRKPPYTAPVTSHLYNNVPVVLPPPPAEGQRAMGCWHCCCYISEGSLEFWDSCAGCFHNFLYSSKHDFKFLSKVISGSFQPAFRFFSDCSHTLSMLSSDSFWMHSDLLPRTVRQDFWVVDSLQMPFRIMCFKSSQNASSWRSIPLKWSPMVPWKSK